MTQPAFSGLIPRLNGAGAAAARQPYLLVEMIF
jgi:hypothetical protein